MYTHPTNANQRIRREKHCKTMKIKLNILLYINIFAQMLIVNFVFNLLFYLHNMFNTITTITSSEYLPVSCNFYC